MPTLRHALALACFPAAAAFAQAPHGAPLVLSIPSSTRAHALGDAWVAGREDFVVFYNPAQVSATTGAGFRVVRFGPSATAVTLAAGQTVGRFNFGWGAELLDAKVSRGATYPYSPADLTSRGSRGLLSAVAAFAGNISYKSTRIGLGAKYAADRVSDAATLGGAGVDAGRVLVDAGASRSLLRGTVALAATSIPTLSGTHAPIRESLGYARGLSTDQIDFNAYAAITHRDGWFGGGGGVEASYGWIEGWSVSLRAGARRPEWTGERPVSFGAGLVGDRLVLDYTIKPMRGVGAIHDLTIRWR